MILKTYIIRTLKDPLNLIMLILFPIAMISVMTFAANANVEGYDHITNGFNRFATGNLTFNVVFFQFFCGMIVTDYLYLDFRSDMRWRLMATPKPFNRFLFSAIASSTFVSILNGAIILAFGRFALSAHLHNLLITGATLIILAVFLTMLGVLCFMFFPKKGTTTAVIMAFAFAQMLPIQFGMLRIEPDVIGAASFMPVVAGVRAMQHSGVMMAEFSDGEFIGMLDADMQMALIHLGILAGFMVVTAIVVAIMGRRRPI